VGGNYFQAMRIPLRSGVFEGKKKKKRKEK